MATQQTSKMIIGVVAVVGLLAGTGLGIILDKMVASGKDSEYISLRSQLLRCPLDDWCRRTQQTVKKLMPKWPESQEYTSNLLSEDIPVLQYAGLVALFSHRAEAPSDLLEKARALTNANTSVVRVVAARFLPEQEQKAALISVANEVLKYQTGVTMRTTPYCDTFVELLRGLEKFPGDDTDEVVYRIAATGDFLALSGGARWALLGHQNFGKLEIISDYLRNLYDKQNEETFWVLDWFQVNSGVELPKPLVYGRIFYWYTEIVSTINRWVKKAPKTSYPPNPVPQFQLPESPFVEDHLPKWPE